jgi:hypothetical protein
MNRVLSILFVFMASMAGADTLQDLKTAVARLPAKQPVRATYATEQTVKAAGRFSNENNIRRVAAEVTHDASGVSITIPQSLLDKAAQEAAHNSGDNTTQRAIGSLRSSQIVDALDFHMTLAALLDGATVTGERRVVFQNRPARLLMLKLNRRPQKDSGSIQLGSSKTDEQMKIWIGDDNLPLAAERTQTTTAGFLVFHGSNTNKTTYSFAHNADRLMLARLETSGTSEGMGQKIDEASVQTLTLH